MACPACNGTGWKSVERSGVRAVVRCDCWRDRVASQLAAEARIPRRYQHCDLTGFVTYDNESLEDALARARRFADAFPVVDRGLFFLGPPGVGKTHLAVSVLRQVVRAKGARGLFYDTRELLRVIRSTYDPVVKTPEMQVLRPVMEAELLVLDDLGAEKTSEWVEETLNLIVNTRYNERRLTLFTSNYADSPNDQDVNSLIFRIGHRMLSRLHEMCEFLEMDGADFRKVEPHEGVDGLKRGWAERQLHDKLRPAKHQRQAKAQLRDGRGDLKWTGGKAGT